MTPAISIHNNISRISIFFPDCNHVLVRTDTGKSTEEPRNSGRDDMKNKGIIPRRNNHTILVETFRMVITFSERVLRKRMNEGTTRMRIAAQRMYIRTG